MIKIKNIYYLIFFLQSLLFSSPDILKFNVSNYNNSDYISLNDFVKQHSLQSNYYETKDKIEIIYKKNKIYLSPSMTFIKINNQIYHLNNEIIFKNSQYYIPLDSFYKSMELAGLPFRIKNKTKREVLVEANIFNVNGIEIKNKKNGTLIRLKTKNKFSKENISTSFSSSKWFNVTILNCFLDTLTINQIEILEPIKKIKTVQSSQSAQISFLLSASVEDIDIDSNDKEINFLLRNSIKENAERINKLKSKWIIDTIVIDPGHGGKDPGAVGHGQKEKDITLDIAKKLGNLVKRNLGTNVVYTREEDDFIPLWKRTKIANDVEGKLFISIHVNATARSASTKGYETFFLRPGKADNAIEVVERENSVIDLEQGEYEYTELTNENYIIASMAQNTFMKESEDFAALIQKHLNKTLKNTTKNRGVKQAGFYVLVGATMPNVLVEVGFISNKQEAKKLSKAYYRRQIAESIYNAIVDFKIKYEKPLLEG